MNSLLVFDAQENCLKYIRGSDVGTHMWCVCRKAALIEEDEAVVLPARDQYPVGIYSTEVEAQAAAWKLLQGSGVLVGKSGEICLPFVVRQIRVDQRVRAA